MKRLNYECQIEFKAEERSSPSQRTWSSLSVQAAGGQSLGKPAGRRYTAWLLPGSWPRDATEQACFRAAAPEAPELRGEQRGRAESLRRLHLVWEAGFTFCSSTEAFPSSMWSVSAHTCFLLTDERVSLARYRWPGMTVPCGAGTHLSLRSLLSLAHGQIGRANRLHSHEASLFLHTGSHHVQGRCESFP